MLETRDVPILSSLPQLRCLGVTIELNPKRDNMTCPALGFYSSPVQYFTMGYLVLDLTSLSYQPKSRERSASPTKHVTFALSKQKLHIQLIYKKSVTTKMTNLLFGQVILPLKMKMISFWCNQHQDQKQ